MNSSSEHLVKTKKAWDFFTIQGQMGNEMIPVRDVVAQSWARCREAEVSFREGKGKILLEKKELSQLIDRNKRIIEISKPIMLTLYESVQKPGCAVLLTDQDGFLLCNTGSIGHMDVVNNLNFIPGTSWSELYMGTNAIGTSLLCGYPLQISGAEHYCSVFHNMTCSASPIRNPGGSTVGCLGITCSISDYPNSHTLGMVIAATKAIENQIRKEDARIELMITHKQLVTVINSISDGFLSVNTKCIITNVNTSAASILGWKNEELIGKNIGEILNISSKIDNIFKTGDEYYEEELIADTSKGPLICTVSAKPIIDSSNIVGIVIIIREIKKVHRIVNEMAGFNAKFHFNDIIGESTAIKAALRRAKKAAASSSTVLLTGESGTGKEVFAHSIHNASNRRNGPFLAINCAAIPRELIHSELFGYNEGAFTGAKRGGRPGKFELASGGTAFLDEIGDMPLDMQANLLRVLQDRAVIRVGGDRPIPVDVRIIAATNKNLQEGISKGNFREDLFYRLNVFTIPIPPLRDRLDDCELMAGAFVETISSKLGKGKITIHPDVFPELKKYPWHGNIRELINILEQAINMIDGNILMVEHLPDLVLKNRRGPTPTRRTDIISLEEAEKKAIGIALRHCGGNITKASKLLGIGRNTLYQKIRKYGFSI